MSSTINAEDVENSFDIQSWLEETLLVGDTERDVYIVAPDTALLYELGQLSIDADRFNRSVSILMSNSVRLEVRRDFAVESLLAGLPESVLFYVVEDEEDYNLPDMTLIGTEFELQALASVGDAYIPLSADSEESAIETFKSYRDLLRDRDEHTFRKPSRTQIYETLETQFDTAVANDYTALLSALEEDDRIDHSDIQADTLAILVAAKHDLPHYDISNWAQDIDLVSKATVSRRKKSIEERNIIETTNIPVDVGRPRQRLHLNDDHDAVDDSIDSLVDVAVKSINWRLQ